MGAQFFFRVDINSDIGAGHLMRCIAIASACERAGHRVCFISNATSESYLSKIDAFEFPFAVLNDTNNDTGSTVELEQIESLLSDNSAPCILIIDGYQFDSDYRQQFQVIAHRHHACVVALDDENNTTCLYLLHGEHHLNLRR